MKIRFFSILLLLLPLAIFAQARIPLVDVVSCEKSIEDNQMLITELETQNQQMAAESAQLLDEIATQKKHLAELEPLEQKVKNTKEEMLLLTSRIADAEAAEKARLAIIKNDELLRRIYQARGEIKRVIYFKEQKLLRNTTLTNQNTTKIHNLNDQLAYLKAAVEKSKIMQQELDVTMLEIEKYLSETDKYINDLTAEQTQAK